MLCRAFSVRLAGHYIMVRHQGINAPKHGHSAADLASGSTAEVSLPCYRRFGMWLRQLRLK